MATKFIFVPGTVKWAKLYEHNADKAYENYSMDLYPTKDGQKLMESSGVQLRKRTDEDGVFYKVKRPFTKVINGDLVEFGPPRVQIEEDGEFVDFEELIGNGSEVVAKIAVYDTRKGKGHRLEAVLINEHVPYEKPERLDDEIEAPKGITPF